MIAAGAGTSIGERLQQLRGALAFLLVLLWMGLPCGVLMYFVAIPASVLFPPLRPRIANRYFRFICRGIFFCLGLGGAKFQRSGHVDTRGRGLIVMNHQSLLDIPALSLMVGPDIPAFIARARYGHWYMPMVGGGIWLIDGPLVDPKRDAQGAIELLGRLAATQDRTFAIYPEGHRTRTGDVGAFRPGGISAILRERPGAPVTLVVTDGFTRARNFVDFVKNVHHLRGRTEVVGVLHAPTDREALPEFVALLETRMREHLHRMRAAAQASDSSAARPALPA